MLSTLKIWPRRPSVGRWLTQTPDIIDFVDEDDVLLMRKDPIPHDLADFDDWKDLMSADVAWGHGGDGGGDDRPPSHQIPTGCGGCLRAYREAHQISRLRTFPVVKIGMRDWRSGNDPKEPSIAALRYMESSATREYPSLIHTFFLTHTVGDVFLNPADKALYDEMLMLQGLGSNTPSGVPYTEDEIMAIVRGGKSDDKFSQMLTQLESQPEYGGGSGSGRCGDDEPGDDEDGDVDEEDEDDS
ncbi:hypothetical protein Tco_1375435 [Tanacetum coccineum]